MQEIKAQLLQELMQKLQERRKPRSPFVLKVWGSDEYPLIAADLLVVSDWSCEVAGGIVLDQDDVIWLINGKTVILADLLDLIPEIGSAIYICRRSTADGAYSSYAPDPQKVQIMRVEDRRKARTSEDPFK
ncbi:MAG: hypothetical protein KatS3mg087_0501 [Patescibacteria group bacterium]|nr:MAG: hypothetical protein KatS3mg087_0501 [Patescibacteria group bacterium]